MVKCFPRYVITTAKHAVKIEPIKYHGIFQNVYLMIMPTETKVAIKVKIAKMYAFVYPVLLVSTEK